MPGFAELVLIASRNLNDQVSSLLSPHIGRILFKLVDRYMRVKMRFQFQVVLLVDGIEEDGIGTFPVGPQRP